MYANLPLVHAKILWIKCKEYLFRMKKILLCILDGFGYSESDSGNATLSAKYVRHLMSSDNTAFLDASGEYVGLPSGQFGNSEVGHLTLGSGRILKQRLPLISDAIESGDLERNQSLQGFLKSSSSKTCHLMGLFSNGGVHSDIEHFFWAVQLLRRKGMTIRAHLFLDGRDVGFRDAIDTLRNALDHDRIRLSEIATIQGRFYAMDRDNRLDRTQRAYDAIVNGSSEYRTNDPLEIIQRFYDDNINDETIPPMIANDYQGSLPGDVFWMLNFRTDRIKQILTMLLDGGANVMNMVDCGEPIDSRSVVLFPTRKVRNTLGEVLSRNGIKQLRVAETEKYAHVTYFFNGGSDVQYDGEKRVLIPSPKVKDYSETPDMSAAEITRIVVDSMKSSEYPVIVANFANADMVGHTGDFYATKLSLECLDDHIKEIVSVAESTDYTVILTADHGNAEEMVNEDGSPKKTHTCSLVPFVIIPEIEVNRNRGALSDVAPTILRILGVERPEEMSGTSFV